jgi:hypothetical protein
MSIDNTPCFISGDNEWDLPDLIKAAEGLPVKAVFLGVLLIPNLEHSDFEKNLQMIREADLKKPILLSPEGNIIDGAYIVFKALMEGNNMVYSKKFKTMPAPSRVIVERSKVY